MPMDDLEADIRAAAESVAKGPQTAAETTPAPEVETPAPDTEAASTESERARDEHGRFAKAETKPEAKPKNTAQSETAGEAAPVAPSPFQPTQPKPQAPAVVPAPTNWKGAGKVAWERLPADVRKEITDDYSRFGDTEARLSRLDAAIGKDRAMSLSATYGSVEQGLQNLFAISDMATQNPVGFIQWFSQQRGINLAQMLGQSQAPRQAPAPQAPDPLMQRLGQLESFVGNFVNQQQTQLTQSCQSEIEEFASDPAHPYFNDVRDYMGDLMKQGRAKDLQQAYDMAVWGTDAIRESLINSQLETRLQQKSQEQAGAVRQARAASVSVSGSPAGASVPGDQPSNETLEQTLRRVQQQVLSA